MQGGEEPKIVNRREHKHSAIVSGRTIGEAREHLETANERAAARKKDKRQHFMRVFFASLGFTGLIIILIILATSFVGNEPLPESASVSETIVSHEPTIEIVDASATTGGKITSRMRQFIGLLESDLRAYGYQPVRAIIPVDSIREVDIYLDGHPGFIKTTIDRGAGVTAEDIDRMLRYLTREGITELEYLDVRIDGRAYWK